MADEAIKTEQEIVKQETRIEVKTENIVFDITELIKVALNAESFADNIEIVNDKDLTFAVEGLAEIKAEIKEGENARKKVVDKPNKYVKQVNSYFKNPIETLEKAEKKINLKMQFYRDLVKQRAEEEQRRKLEEYNRRVEEEKIQAAREQRREQIIAPPKAAFQEMPNSIKTATVAATFSDFWDYEIQDVQKVYESHPEIVSLDIKRREALELLKTTQDVPGLLVFKNTRTINR